MKLIRQTFACLSLMGLPFAGLEAKSLEVLLDQTTQGTVTIESNSKIETCNQITIENIGSFPITGCLPCANEAPCLSLESLAEKIAGKPYPLVALYQFWNQSLIKDDTLPPTECHPLDLLNFQGTCSAEAFAFQFIRLCNALGIQTRAANVQGNGKFDFSLEDGEEWCYLDIGKQQHYLGWDNEALVSSEHVMDDPFLALRAKHQPKSQLIDFRENWKELAQFEIIDAASAMPIHMEVEEIGHRAQGFDLFPQETLVFERPAFGCPDCLPCPDCFPCPDCLPCPDCAIQHTVLLEKRNVPLQWTYNSPCPLQKLVNQSSSIITIIEQGLKLQPGESLEFADKDIFQLHLAFSEKPQGRLIISGKSAWSLFPHFKNGGNQLFLSSKSNPTQVRLTCEINEINQEKAVLPALTITNESETFDYCAPYFKLQNPGVEFEKVWWQISLDPNFELIPSNFDQIEAAAPTLTLPLISETFLSPGVTYYFRVKGSCKGQWSEWSVPFAFKVNKPLAVERAEFDQTDENSYELNWERYAEDSDEPIEYWVFGSNSIDFIPSIYCDKQVNAVIGDAVVEEENNDNLIAVTTETSLQVTGGLAYYRIIAKKRGQFAIPSELIRVYDEELVQPRNVLQLVKDDENRFIAKRTLFPPAYPWSEISYPHYTLPVRENALTKIQALLRSKSSLETKYQYEFPEVDESVWEEVRPYLLPANHPAWPKLNRVFCKYRATLNSETFKKSGFKRYRPGRWSRVSASGHAEFKEYFIKAYCDVELGILYDWRKWIHRIKGAECIRQCIKDYQLEAHFKVPHKWIYPLPKNPAPPTSSRYLRKNFILVAENMRIEEHSANEKLYKKHMTPKLMKGLYIILQVCGLYDSVYCFNIPFCKDGKIAVIDTEYHHKWPVPFSKLSKSFSSKMRYYWSRLTHKGGSIPDGKTLPNPPRMDRRDKPDDHH